MSRDIVEIKFKNNGIYNKDAINCPITHNEVCIGLVTDVDDDYVYGLLWANMYRSVFCDGSTIADISMELADYL